MIRLRYSPEPYQELELEGTNAELAELRQSIRGFADDETAWLDVPAETEFDPSPYLSVLSRLLVRKSSDRIVLAVENDILVLSAKPAFLRLFADNLPSNAERTSSVAYHVHFDRVGREDQVSEKSCDIVLTLKH